MSKYIYAVILVSGCYSYSAGQIANPVDSVYCFKWSPDEIHTKQQCFTTMRECSETNNSGRVKNVLSWCEEY